MKEMSAMKSLYAVITAINWLISYVTSLSREKKTNILHFFHFLEFIHCYTFFRTWTKFQKYDIICNRMKDLIKYVTFFNSAMPRHIINYFKPTLWQETYVWYFSVYDTIVKNDFLCIFARYFRELKLTRTQTHTETGQMWKS